MLKDSYRFAAKWEPLFFKDGSLVFNNFFGEHLRIASPEILIKEIVKKIESKKSTSEILESMDSPKKTKQAMTLIHKLESKGFIEEDLIFHEPRFQSQLDWLREFEGPSASAQDLMKRVQSSKVGIIGLGGTGSMIAMALAASGFKNIRLMDGDQVDESNLNRQIFFKETESNRVFKVDAMKIRMQELYSSSRVEVIKDYVNERADVERFAKDLDFIFLCADAPRFILNRWVNDVCVDLDISYINAFSGFVGPIFIPGRSPCFTCVEDYLRSKFGSNYDQMIEALQVRRSRQYPAFVGGIFQAAQIQFMEGFAYLSGCWEPKTIGKALRPSYASICSEEIPYSSKCKCSNQKRRYA